MRSLEPAAPGDDDVVFAGSCGDDALRDFPHARENCLEKPFVAGGEHLCCANCFCCARPGSQPVPPSCNVALALNAQRRWVDLRKSWQASRRGGQSASGSASSSSAAATTSASGPSSTSPATCGPPKPPSRRLSTEERRRWPVDEILKAVEQVYPIEAPEPAGFCSAYRLRPYQRQSLAFMLQLEASNDAVHSAVPSKAEDRRRHYSVSRPPVKGGWLCDEMGMGKTAVCAALVLASKGLQTGKVGESAHGLRRCTVVLVNNTLVGQWEDEMRKFAPTLNIVKYYGGSKRPLTQAYLDSIDILITTPHTSGKSKSKGSQGASAVAEEEEKDGSPSAASHLYCRRLILDESHLYEAKSEPKLPNRRAFDVYRPRYLWCVTGTPCSTSLAQLETQARMMGQWTGGLQLFQVLQEPPAYDPPRPHERTQLTNEQVVEKLRTIMIRHSKSQRIAGEAALSLPESECDTAWLDFSRDERVLYGLHGCTDGVPKWADANRQSQLTISDVTQGLSRRRSAVAHVYHERAVTGETADQKFTLSKPDPSGQMRRDACAAYRRLAAATASRSYRQQHCSKYAALFSDLAQLQAEASDGAEGVSVVIFTHYNEVLDELCEMLRAASSYVVYQVSRQTDPERRHRALRAFQNEQPASSASASKMKVFATTFATAAVGLTLTAASRVYLLESSLDPAEEAQAAGRIHRLGQTKQVLVKRFFFRDSIDEAVHQLHRQVRSGAVSLSGGRFPDAALQVFREHGVAQPHQRDATAPMVEAKRRYRSSNKRNVEKYGGAGGFDYGKTVQTQPCSCCGKAVEVPGTSDWWGKGIWAAELTQCTEDYPDCLRGESSATKDE